MKPYLSCKKCSKCIIKHLTNELNVFNRKLRALERDHWHSSRVADTFCRIFLSLLAHQRFYLQGLVFSNFEIFNSSRFNTGRRTKNNLIFIQTFCGASKSLMKTSKAFIKPFEALQRSVIILIYFFSYYSLKLSLTIKHRQNSVSKLN